VNRTASLTGRCPALSTPGLSASCVRAPICLVASDLMVRRTSRIFRVTGPAFIGVDFGYTHPFAAAELCWDRDSDCVYVTKTHRVSEQSPIYHAAALRAWGAREIPVAWPRDGRRQTLEGAGIPLAEQYRNQGLNMLFEHAQFPDGGVSVEAGLMLMLDRMKTGKLKVFRELNDFFEEFRLYHRKDGKVFAENDDIYALSATA
jgi:hypothetical protein